MIKKRPLEHNFFLCGIYDQRPLSPKRKSRKKKSLRKHPSPSKTNPPHHDKMASSSSTRISLHPELRPLHLGNSFKPNLDYFPVPHLPETHKLGVSITKNKNPSVQFKYTLPNRDSV